MNNVKQDILFKSACKDCVFWHYLALEINGYRLGVCREAEHEKQHFTVYENKQCSKLKVRVK